MKTLLILLFVSVAYSASFKENVTYCKKLYGAGNAFESCIQKVRTIKPTTRIMDACMRWGGTIATLESCLINLKKRRVTKTIYEMCNLSSDLPNFYYCIDQSKKLYSRFQRPSNFKLYSEYCKTVYSEGDGLLLCLLTMLDKRVRDSELKACYHWNSTIPLLNDCIDGLQERRYNSFIYESCQGSDSLERFFKCTDNLQEEKRRF